MDQQLLQQTLNFVERVTHWKEGGPDFHDTLFALRAAIAQPEQPVPARELFRGGCKECAAKKQADVDNKEWQDSVKNGNELVSMMARKAIAQQEQTTTIAHSLAGFIGGFTVRYRRPPTDQEIWNHAIRSWRDLNPVAQQEQPAAPPLSPEDYSAIRAKLCEAHPGDWLHHYGPAVEAEILKRLRATA